MSETPEQTAALDALETTINALTSEQRAALEQYLQKHETAPSNATEAVALIPSIEKAIAVVSKTVVVTSSNVISVVRNAAQTTPAVRPLQPLER